MFPPSHVLSFSPVFSLFSVSVSLSLALTLSLFKWRNSLPATLPCLECCDNRMPGGQLASKRSWLWERCPEPVAHHTPLHCIITFNTHRDKHLFCTKIKSYIIDRENSCCKGNLLPTEKCVTPVALQWYIWSFHTVLSDQQNPNELKERLHPSAYYHNITILGM